METPILSKKQLKSSLSAKKNRPREKIKNVIKLPYNNYYWPELSIDEQEQLENVLTQNLPCYLDKKIEIPWHELKNIPKSERKDYRLKYAQDCKIIQTKSQRPEGIYFGINRVSKALEANSVQSILISAEVEPRLLIQHIIDQAVLYNVPTLCVHNLRDKMKSITGIGTVCFGIGKDLCDDPKYKLIIENIESNFKKMPPPTSHINYNRSINSFKIQDKSKEPKDEEKKEKVEVNEAEIRENVYLKRPNDHSRAFIPVVENFEEKLTMEVDQTGFVAFTEHPVSENKINLDLSETKMQYTLPVNKQFIRANKKANSRSQYKALIVKRLKGDSNRIQKKINKMNKNDK